MNLTVVELKEEALRLVLSLLLFCWQACMQEKTSDMLMFFKTKQTELFFKKNEAPSFNMPFILLSVVTGTIAHNYNLR